MQHCGTPTGAEVHGSRPSETHYLMSVRKSNKTRFMTFDRDPRKLEIIQFKGKQNKRGVVLCVIALVGVMFLFTFWNFNIFKS
mgnify:CR=1 FL=1